MSSILNRHVGKYSQSDNNPGPLKVPKYSHARSASYSTVSEKRVGAKSQIPRSLSILHLLKLGKVQKKERLIEGITIENFAVSQKEWIQLDQVPFEVTKQHFGEGGFKRTFKASSGNILFQNKSWVLKKYHESSKKIVDELGVDVECQTRKAIQMDCLSRHLAFAFEQLCNRSS